MPDSPFGRIRGGWPGSAMSQNDLNNGRLVCPIGLAALDPAEFVIFRIGHSHLWDRRVAVVGSDQAGPRVGEDRLGHVLRSAHLAKARPDGAPDVAQLELDARPLAAETGMRFWRKRPMAGGCAASLRRSSNRYRSEGSSPDQSGCRVPDFRGHGPVQAQGHRRTRPSSTPEETLSPEELGHQSTDPGHSSGFRCPSTGRTATSIRALVG